MIRLFIIIFALVAAVGGGLGGLVHFAIIPDFTGGMIANVVGVVGQPVAGEEAAEAPPPPPVEPVYAQMAPMLIPVIQNGELKRNIYIALRIELVKEKQAEGYAAMPRLQDLYLRALYDLIPEQQKDKETLDLQKIRDRLMVITERAVGPGVVKGIIFQSVFSR